MLKTNLLFVKKKNFAVELPKNASFNLLMLLFINIFFLHLNFNLIGFFSGFTADTKFKYYFDLFDHSLISLLVCMLFLSLFLRCTLMQYILINTITQ